MNSKLGRQHTAQRQMNFRFVNAFITAVALSLLNLRNVPAVLTFKSETKLWRCSVKIQIKPLWTAILLFVCYSILYKIHLPIFTMVTLIQPETHKGLKTPYVFLIQHNELPTTKKVIFKNFRIQEPKDWQFYQHWSLRMQEGLDASGTGSPCPCDVQQLCKEVC